MRRVDYRTAVYGFLIAFFWLVLGAILLCSPVPRALDIAWQFFAVWMVLFFLIAGVAGALLTVAALNGAFPGGPRSRRRTAAPAPPSTLWATPPASPDPRSGARRQG